MNIDKVDNDTFNHLPFSVAVIVAAVIVVTDVDVVVKSG